jgi:hypothetical protein
MDVVTRTLTQWWTLTQGLAPAGDTAWIGPGAHIAALTRNAGSIDLFYVDPFGEVKNMLFNTADHSVIVQAVTNLGVARAGGGVAAVARKVDSFGDPLRDNDHMDVFTIGRDGHIVHVPWRYGDDNYAWNPGRAESLAAIAQPGAEISAIAPYAGSIQVAAKKPDGTLVHTWYEDVELDQINWQIAGQ